MRNKILIGLAAVAITAPSLASAHSYCEDRAHHRKVVGTVAGAAGGALIGGMLGHGAAAPLLGAAGGAIVGNQVARVNCPPERRYHSRHYYRHDRYYHHDDYRHDDRHDGYYHR
jgi:uncharacterized protein YcfJ